MSNRSNRPAGFRREGPPPSVIAEKQRTQQASIISSYVSQLQLERQIVFEESLTGCHCYDCATQEYILKEISVVYN